MNGILKYLTAFLISFPAAMFAADCRAFSIPTIDPLTDSGNVAHNLSTVASSANTALLEKAHKEIKSLKAKYDEYKGDYEGVMLKDKAPLEGSKTIKKSVIADTSDYESVRRAFYDLFLAYPNENDTDQTAYNRKADEFYQDSMNEIYTAVRLLEQDYNTNLKKKIEQMSADLLSGENGASVPSDENGSWKNAYNAYKTFDDLTQILEELTAMKAQYEAVIARRNYIRPASPSKSQKNKTESKKEEKQAENLVNPELKFAQTATATTGGGMVIAFGQYSYRYNPDTDSPVSFVEAPAPDVDSPYANSRAELADLDKLNPVYDKALETLEIHNLLQSLPSQRAQFVKYNQYVRLHQKAVEAVEASDKCVLSYLGRYYKDPENVWNGKFIGSQTTDYDLREGLSGWALKSYETAKAAKADDTVDTSAFSEIEVDPSISNENLADLEKQKKHVEKQAETNTGLKDSADVAKVEANTRDTDLIAWNIGAEAARNLADDQYLNSPRWGTPFKKFSIWNDQKSYYNQYLDGKYENMKAYLNRLDFSAKIVSLAQELNTLSTAKPELKLFAQTSLAAMLKEASKISEVVSDGEAGISNIHGDKSSDVETLKKNKEIALESLKKTQKIYEEKLNAASQALDGHTRRLNRVQVPEIGGGNEVAEDASAAALKAEIAADKKAVAEAQRKLDAVNAKIAEIEKAFIQKEQRIESKYAETLSSLLAQSLENKPVGLSSKLSEHSAADLIGGIAYVKSLLGQSENIMADTKNYAAEAIDETRKDIAAMGDEIYFPQNGGKILARHRELIALLKNLPYEIMVKSYPSMKAVSSSQTAVTLVTTAFQSVLVNIVCPGGECDVYDEDYFVGSSGKARDFRAPKPAPDTHAAPVREVVHLDYVDYQNIPKLNDGSVAKESMLDYGSPVPEVWKMMLKNPAYVEKDMDFGKALSLGGEARVLMRGGILPCRYNKMIIDAEDNKATYYVVKNGSGNYPECRLLKATLGSASKGAAVAGGLAAGGLAGGLIGGMIETARVENTEVEKDNKVTVSIKKEVAEASPSELGIFLTAQKAGLYFGKMDNKVYGRLVEIMNDKSSAEYKENIPDNIYRHASFNENQIGSFLKTVETELEYRQILEELEVKIAELKEEVLSALRKAGFSPSQDFDLANDEDYEQALKALNAMKNKNILSATESLDEISYPENNVVKDRMESLRNMFGAMSKDKNELLQISQDVKNDSAFDERLKTEEVNRTVADKYQKEADEAFEKELATFPAPYCAAY